MVITDYPSDAVLGNIRTNAQKAIPTHLQPRYKVLGCEWGDLESDFAVREAQGFTRILAADCYWMPNEHENLVLSMLHFIANSPTAEIFAIAGFHTGRAKLASFFDIALSKGLMIEEIYEEDAFGNRREWAKERDCGREHTAERKKWLLIARLKRGPQ